MPLFEIPSQGPKHLLDEQVFHKYGVDTDADILALAERAEAAHQESSIRCARVNTWVDAENLEQQLSERIREATTRAALRGTRDLLMRSMAEDETGAIEGMETFLARQDPIIRTSHLQGMVSAYSDFAQKVETMASYAASVLPEMKENVRQTLWELARMMLLQSISYNKTLHLMLERIEHGVPEWDNEKGCEKPLEPGLPSMEGSTTNSLQSSTSDETLTTDDEAVAARLLSNLFD